MGNCWSCIDAEATTATAPSATTAPVPALPPSPAAIVPALPPSPAAIVPALPPSPDLAPSSDYHLSDGDTSFMGGNSWFSMLTTNFTTRLSRAIRGGKNVADDNELSDAPVDAKPLSMDTRKLQSFTYIQLAIATRDFRNDLVLGRGGFGRVYKGWLIEKSASEGFCKRVIAVKKLESGSKQGVRQGRTEVEFLRRLSHPNIVNLVGFYEGPAEFMIVYEFMSQGSLNYHLFSKGSDRLLPWEKRVKVAVGMARGLSYLHTRETPIVYRDFKSSNILLSGDYTPKISDFGLAKCGPAETNESVTAHVMGTVGYAAPEYVSRGSLYVKSDVYSFGVVLVEMLTGLRAIDKKRPPKKQNLVEWAKPLLSNRRELKHIMDTRLEGKYAIKEASATAVLAVKCLHQEPQFRPSMKEVAETLEQIGAYHKV